VQSGSALAPENFKLDSKLIRLRFSSSLADITLLPQGGGAVCGRFATGRMNTLVSFKQRSFAIRSQSARERKRKKERVHVSFIVHRYRDHGSAVIIGDLRRSLSTTTNREKVVLRRTHSERVPRRLQLQRSSCRSAIRGRCRSLSGIGIK